MLPPNSELVALQLPGRQKRLREPALCDVAEAVRGMLPDVAALTDRNTVFFGDCTGSLLAYEAIMALAATGSALPGHFVVSCCRAPHLRPRHEALYRLDDAALVAQLRALSFAPEWLLNDGATLAGFLPILRCDFELAESYEPTALTRLPVPLTAIAATRDKITPEADVADWRAYTSEKFESIRIEGTHDLVHSATLAITAAISRAAGCAGETSSVSKG